MLSQYQGRNGKNNDYYGFNCERVGIKGINGLQEQRIQEGEDREPGYKKDHEPLINEIAKQVVVKEGQGQEPDSDIDMQ